VVWEVGRDQRLELRTPINSVIALARLLAMEGLDRTRPRPHPSLPPKPTVTEGPVRRAAVHAFAAAEGTMSS
jgi:hypothetical protein